MKRIIASVGLAAVGAASVQGVNAQTSPSGNGDNPRFWGLVALRGFYDDNIATAPSGPFKASSYGFEINPSLGYALRGEQTSLTAAYAYSYKYFENRPPAVLDHDDQSHTFDFLLDHRFSERLKADVSDSFVVGQEAETLEVLNVPYTKVQRIPGNNIRNYGTIRINDEFTPQLSIEAGYENTFFKYADESPFDPTTGRVSLSGLLNRLEHLAHLDARWKLQPDGETVALVGYQFGMVDYTGNAVIGSLPDGNDARSDVRNNRSQYGYIGAEHYFLPRLFGRVHVGVRYTDNYNSPDGNTELAPYVMGELSYTLDSSAESYVKVGAKCDRSSADAFSTQGNSITHDSDSTVVYGLLRHRIPYMPDLYGSVSGTYQHNAYNGGATDGQSDDIYLLGLNLEYRIPVHSRYLHHVAANVSYNYDKLNSDRPDRGFDRNRVFIGVTAAY